ncbi:hAT transposon superfamily protein [Striga hermonthica]|uniref:HAT transposon superfamily protein n=1 Tax=Striga hermonthica TaxID=68872 RepID=A0A9N7MIP4_STRHE|nr:hAT transposon superfamily protein [Striga hermonthica]
MDKFTKPLDASSLSKTIQPKISEHIMKERLHKLKRYVARWLYVRGIPFNAINNEEFDQMLEAVGRYGPGAKKPYQHELREKLLHEEVSDTKEMLKLQENEWAKNGFSIMTDAWTDQKRRSIMNLCVNCSIGTSFLESKEASSESHTGELIFDYVNSCIVVQVVTDNASNNMAAKNMLSVVRPNIFWSSCATHTINLMLEGIGKMKKFKSIVDQAKSLTIFIYAHHKTLSLMRKFTKKRDIIRPGVTRFASNFLTLQSLYEKKDQLRMMSQSDEWEKINQVKKSAKGVQATTTLVRPNFWNGVSLCLRVFEPLVKVLRMVDGYIKPSMAFLYGEILKAKEDIRVAVGNVDRSGTLYNSIITIIDEKMKDRLDCPLHKAAYFLNPYYSYSDPTIFQSEEVMDGFISAVETFYHGDYDKQNQVLNEDVHKFKDQVEHFSKKVALAGCMDFEFSPAKWWGNYGTQVRTLQKMAIRILYLTSSASGCERSWSCFEGIHRSKRNRLTCERLEQLVFVRFNNLHADKKKKAQKNKKMDPLLATEATHAQGWIVEGEDDEDADVEPVTGLTWKLIAETCGAEEVTKLRRSARLNETREIEDDVHSEHEEEQQVYEEEIEFESDQEDVVMTGYGEEEEIDD